MTPSRKRSERLACRSSNGDISVGRLSKFPGIPSPKAMVEMVVGVGHLTGVAADGGAMVCAEALAALVSTAQFCWIRCS